MGIGRILLSSQHFFYTPNSLQLPLNHPPCCCRWDSALCPKWLNYHDFIPQNYGRTWTSEITKNRGRLMLGLNNTPSRGYSHESNAIYLEEIHSELTEFYTSRLFLILTDHGNVVSKCQVWVIVGPRSPTGLGKIWKNAYHARKSVVDTYVRVSRNNVKNPLRYT